MKARIEFNVHDDFEKGCCYDCPLAYEHEDLYGDYVAYCPMEWTYDKCRLEILDEDKED